MRNLRKIRKNPESARRARYYDFGPFRIDLLKRVLLRDGAPLAVTAKALETLVVLVENRGELVLKEDLIASIWPDTVVEDGSLNRNISTLRRALGDSPRAREYVITVPRRGYRFVGDVREIGDSSTRSADAPIASLAVLPFANLTGDSAQEYLADGLTEALVTDLAQIRALHVVSRTSVMRYKATDRSLPEIATELNVAGVIEGSVMREGRRVRITVQLIDGATDRHLWANSYEGELRDVLDLQSAVARAIVRELRISLTPSERSRLGVSRVVDPKAHEAYLKGRHFWNQRTWESLERSVACFDEALREDPGYALAYAGKAQALAVMLDYGVRAPRTLAPAALRAAQQALALDGELAAAHATLALLELIYEWNLAGAEREFRDALELAPGDPTIRQWYGVLLMYRLRFDESIEQMQAAKRLDPLAPPVRAALAFVYVHAGQYDKAIAEGEALRELEPNAALAYCVLGLARKGKREFRPALADLRRYADLAGRDPDALMRLGCACAAAGEPAGARAILSELRGRSAQSYVSAVCIASLESALGERERALAILEAGVRERATLMLMLGVDPAFAPLHDEPRFQAILRKVGLPAARPRPG
jgi:TolB-like protein/tetratricopeptide (TPR) repeat protein